MDALAFGLTWLDYGAVAVFGATGALAAARRNHDIVTFGFFAAVTGVGGGTLRDLLIGAPVFWVETPGYVLACLVAALAVWMFGFGRWRELILLWLDALGMAAYAVVGAAKAASLGAPPLAAVVMGVLTATFGGIVRDVLGCCCGARSMSRRPCWGLACSWPWGRWASRACRPGWAGSPWRWRCAAARSSGAGRCRGFPIAGGRRTRRRGRKPPQS